MTAAKLSIRLDRHFFTKLDVAANPDFDRALAQRLIENAPITSAMDIETIPGESAVACTQTVRLPLDTTHLTPYSLDIECVGFFVYSGGAPDEAARQQMAKIAHQVLYAAVREMVLTMTGRMAWGPFSIGLAVLGNLPEPV
jgi:hypothetical protein